MERKRKKRQQKPLLFSLKQDCVCCCARGSGRRRASSSPWPPGLSELWWPDGRAGGATLIKALGLFSAPRPCDSFPLFTGLCLTLWRGSWSLRVPERDALSDPFDWSYVELKYLSRAAHMLSLSKMEQKRQCVKMIVLGGSPLSMLVVFPWKPQSKIHFLYVLK